MGAINRIISDGKTPAQVRDEMAAKGIIISERTLRERAREKGACRILGRTMILLPEHIDMIFEEPECHSKNTNAAKSGGSVEELRMGTDMSAKALEHLMRPLRTRRSEKSKPSRGNIVSLAPTRQSRKTS